jgi:DNA repair protein RadB
MPLQRTIHMIPTGCGSLDKLLCGGILTNEISLVYGEAETGKTCLAIQCAVNSARLGYKTLFIDSDGTFPSERLSQIAHNDLNEVSPMITLVKPSTFQEQALVINRLEEYLSSTIVLVIVDTVTSLYRAEASEEKEKTFGLNRELGRQLACLAQIAKTKKVAVLITSQVHNTFFEGSGEMEPVATRVLRFWSDAVLKLKSTSQRNTVKAVIEKHVERKCPADCYFSIEEAGIREHNQ